MKFAAATALMIAGASATFIPAYNLTEPVWVTEVVTALTTFCPFATELTHAGVTYTVSEATTLTITDCPCTISHTTTWAAPPTSTPAPAPVYTTPVAPYPVVNSTSCSLPAGTAAPTGSMTTSSGPMMATANAASNVFAASGAGLAAVAGAIAYLL